MKCKNCYWEAEQRYCKKGRARSAPHSVTGCEEFVSHDEMQWFKDLEIKAKVAYQHTT